METFDCAVATKRPMEMMSTLELYQYLHSLISLSLPVSTKKNPCQRYLARPTCMKSPQNGYWQEHYVEIDNDTSDRTSKKSIIIITTMSGY